MFLFIEKIFHKIFLKTADHGKKVLRHPSPQKSVHFFLAARYYWALRTRQSKLSEKLKTCSSSIECPYSCKRPENCKRDWNASEKSVQRWRPARIFGFLVFQIEAILRGIKYNELWRPNLKMEIYKNEKKGRKFLHLNENGKIQVLESQESDLFITKRLLKRYNFIFQPEKQKAKYGRRFILFKNFKRICPVKNSY